MGLGAQIARTLKSNNISDSDLAVSDQLSQSLTNGNVPKVKIVTHNLFRGICGSLEWDHTRKLQVQSKRAKNWRHRKSSRK